MVTKAGLPEYDLVDVRAAANQLNLEFRGRKVRLDILNLDYKLKDVALCLAQLSESDYRKTICYEDRLPDDEYIIVLNLAMKSWRLTSCTSNIASLKAAC